MINIIKFILKSPKFDACDHNIRNLHTLKGLIKEGWKIHLETFERLCLSAAIERNSNSDKHDKHGERMELANESI